MPAPRLDEAFALTSRKISSSAAFLKYGFAIAASPVTSTIKDSQRDETVISTQGESIFVYDLRDQTALASFNVTSSTRFTCPAVSIIQPAPAKESKDYTKQRHVIVGVAPQELWVWTRKEHADSTAFENQPSKKVLKLPQPVISLQTPANLKNQVLLGFQDSSIAICDFDFENITPIQPFNSLSSSSTSVTSTLRFHTYPQSYAPSSFSLEPSASVAFVTHITSDTPPPMPENSSSQQQESSSSASPSPKKRNNKKRKNPAPSDDITSDNEQEQKQLPVFEGKSTAKIAIASIDANNNKDNDMQIDGSSSSSSSSTTLSPIGSLELPGDKIADVVVNQNGIVTCSCYDGSLNTYRIEYNDQDKKPHLQFLNTVHLAPEISQPSLLSLSSSFVLLVNANNLVIFDSIISAPVASQNLNPSAATMYNSKERRSVALSMSSSEPWSACTRGQGSIALILLGGSTVVCSPIFTPKHSKLSYALIKSELASRFIVQQPAQATATTASSSSSSSLSKANPDWIRNPLMGNQRANHLAQRAAARKVILESLNDKELDSTEKDRKWSSWVESEREIIKSYKQEKLDERSSRATSQKQNGILETYDDQFLSNDNNDNDPQLPVPFVEKILKIAAAENLVNTLTYLIDRNVVSNSMVPGIGLLRSLENNGDWTNIFAILNSSCPDLPELDLVKILKSLLDESNTTDTQRRDDYIKAFILYPMTKHQLRQALKSELDVNEALQFFERLAVLVDTEATETENNKDHLQVSKAALDTMQLCLDAHLVSILQNQTTHDFIRKVKDDIQTQLDLSRALRDLGLGPLSTFAETHKKNQTLSKESASTSKARNPWEKQRNVPSSASLGPAAEYQVELIEL